MTRTLTSILILVLFDASANAQFAFPGGGASTGGAAVPGSGFATNPGMALPTAPGSEPVPGNYFYPTTPQKSPQANVNPNDDDGPSLKDETKKDHYSRYLNAPPPANQSGR